MTRVIFAAIGILAISMLDATAAEAPDQTEPQRWVERLLDVAEAQTEYDEAQQTERLAKRWQGLVRQRQWTDATGKYKTFASYLSHDPKLAWIELRVMNRTAEGPQYKTVKVPLAKLDKSAGDLLKRIAIARPQVEKALAELRPEDGAMADADYGRGGAAEGVDAIAADPNAYGAAYGRGYGGYDEAAGEPGDAEASAEQGDQPAYVGGVRAAADWLAGRVGATQGTPPTPDLSRDDGDAAPINVPDGSDAAPPGTDAAGTGRFSDQSGAAPSANPLLATARLIEPETPEIRQDAAWRHDFETFRASLTTTQDESGRPAPAFGEVEPLATAYDLLAQAYAAATDPDKMAQSQSLTAAAADVLDGAGDVVWEATLIGPLGAPGEPVALDLPGLDRPFSIEFLLDDPPGATSQLAEGQPVRFIARFLKSSVADLRIDRAGIMQVSVKMAVRFPSGQPTPGGRR